MWGCEYRAVEETVEAFLMRVMCAKAERLSEHTHGSHWVRNDGK